MEALSILFAGIAVGAALTLGAAVLREKPRTPAHWVGGLFSLSVAGYGLVVPEGLPPVQPFAAIAQTLAWAGTAYFWLFAVTVFSDARVRPILFAPVAFMSLVGVMGALTPRPASAGIWLAHNLFEVALTAHILWTIWKSAGGDLVEARRSVRAPFFAAVCLYAIAQSGIEIVEIATGDRSWGMFALALTLAALSLLGSALFVQLRPGLLPDTAARSPDAPADDARVPAADRALAAKLEAAMEAGAWRREGLTIGALAAELGAPEHRLRRLINDSLGHRNFADFLNGRRIAAAKAALADPARAREPVSAIAFDLGYASLGPFNRAFKDATGQTPTEWRKAALDGR